MMLDVFRDDAFHFTKLTAAINKIPYAPTRLGSLNLFQDVPVSTLSVAIEMQNNVLTLVPTAARGTSGVVKNPQRRNVRDFRTVHLPQRVAVMADEIANLRAFGSESEVETAMRYLQRKAAIPRRDLDVTHEWQRMGALKGEVLDADGTTVIYNWFTEFGVTQSTDSIALSNSGTKVNTEITALKRLIEDKLGGVMMAGIRVLCSAEFFDALVSHPAVVEAYKYQQSQFLRSDNRDGFEFAGVVFEEYRGTIGGQRFIAANKAYAIPMGVSDMFVSYYSPAPYRETVNTEGLPFYMKERDLDWDIGVEWQIQSNPLHMCTRPEAVVELTAT